MQDYKLQSEQKMNNEQIGVEKFTPLFFQSLI
nr:MAG TPA: hypothetical protein [Caudoviricetes sp.]